MYQIKPKHISKIYKINTKRPGPAKPKPGAALYWIQLDILVN